MPTDDIADHYRRMNEAIAAQNRKMPAVDHNGVPLDPALGGNAALDVVQSVFNTITEENQR